MVLTCNTCFVKEVHEYVSDELLTPKKVHAEYGLAPQMLANLRWKGAGPDYVKTSSARSGRVLYRRSALERWLEAQTVTTGGAR